ncbi:MAG: radical SAM protein [candidate division Zixibacteria bacterium]|nr:radical SAM protein [candidate division Zixibacteria bacterium]
MKISECTNRSILVPCSLKNFEYQIDPYIGCEHFCRYCYVLNQAETDWTKEVFIHKDITNQLSNELDNIEPQKIYMGYYSDPYQPCEENYLQTRKALELLAENRFSVSILTKSNLVTRDIDILSKMSDASISVSVAFNDNSTRKYFEAKTIDTEDRIAALRKLKNAGISTSALLCPVIPYITDVKHLINLLAPYTNVIWIYALSFLDTSDPGWQNVKAILKNEYSDLSDKIEETIFNKDHIYWKNLRQELIDLQEKKKLSLNIHI